MHPPFMKSCIRHCKDAAYDRAIFNCHAQGYSNGVYWYINGSDSYTQSTYEAKVFTFIYTELPCPNNQLREYNYIQ